MKKGSIIKAIVITFLAYVVLSWIIPTGVFSNGVFTKTETVPVGLGDLFIYPISTSVTSLFLITGLIVLLIGALYGVINKTGVYQELVEKTVSKFKGKEKRFLVISIVMFTLLASLTTLTLPLFVLVPFFVAVILTLGFSKMTALLSTVISILVGNMGAIFGYNTGGYSYMNYFFETKTLDNIVYKIVLFVLLLVVLLIFVLKTSKVEVVKKPRKNAKKEEEVEAKEISIPLYKKCEGSKKSSLPLVITIVVMTVIALVAMFNWAGAIGSEKTIFTTWYTNLTDIKLNGYPLFKNILGSVNPFGLWTNYEFGMLIMITIIVIGLIYNLKVKDIYESMLDGMKEVLGVAVIAVLANILLLIVNSNQTNFVSTIYNFVFGLSKNFNIMTMSLVTLIGSIGFSDFPYLMNSLYDPIRNTFSNDINIIVFILQSLYGLVMLIVPTSVGLVIGLKYMNISYKEWLKENWKLLVCLFLTALIVIIIMSIII